MAFGNRQWLGVHHTKPSTLGCMVSGWLVQTNDTTHFQKPWITNLKITVDNWCEKHNTGFCELVNAKKSHNYKLHQKSQ